MSDTISRINPKTGKRALYIKAIDNNGVEQLKTPAEWSKITGLSSDTIRTRTTNELDQREQGFNPRNMRQIVGLDEFEKRPNGSAAKKLKDGFKAPHHDICKYMNMFTLGRV